jgi:GT2 family glycosyltransferase
LSSIEISVVVPTRQRRDLVLRLLGALREQDLAMTAIEAVIAIDRSTDGTAEAVAEFPAPYRLLTVTPARPGRAAACNEGIAASHGDVILLLDDDMEPVESCLRRHLQRHRGAARCCAIGAVPVRTDTNAPFVERYIAARFESHLAKLSAPGHAFVLRDFYSGNASIRRAVLEEVGGFDESFTVYGNEDLELAFRLRRAGVELQFDPEAVAFQRYTKTFVELERDNLAKGHTAVLLATTHPETFPELNLAHATGMSRRWRSVRSVLLAAARSWPPSVEIVIRASAALERTGIGRARVFYAFVLDYLYWAGVTAALAEGAGEGSLGAVASELQRGPIGLLLHG